MDDHTNWYRWDALKRLIGVSRPTIERWAKAGIFPNSVKLGPRTRPGIVAWPADQIRQWLMFKSQGLEWRATSPSDFTDQKSAPSNLTSNGELKNVRL